MKTMITLAIIALFAATAVQSEVFTKGGASSLVKRPAVVSTDHSASPTTAMHCGMCQSAFVTVNTPTFKGTTPATATMERHGCGSCGTQWLTSGHGKARIDVAKHSCGSGSCVR